MAYFIAFTFGLLASFGALIIELFFLSWTIDTTSKINLTETAFTPTFFSLLILALIEEGAKIIFFLRSRTRFGTLSYTPLLFGTSFGVGFASLEYFALSHLEVTTNGPLLGILLVHIVTSILLVYLLRNTFTKNRILATLGILTLLHFVYNILL